MDVPACQGMSKFPSNVPNTSYGRSKSEHSILEWIALGGAIPVLIPVPSGRNRWFFSTTDFLGDDNPLYLTILPWERTHTAQRLFLVELMLHFLKPWIGYPCLRSVLLSITMHMQICNTRHAGLWLKPPLTARVKTTAACGGLKPFEVKQKSSFLLKMWP